MKFRNLSLKFRIDYELKRELFEDIKTKDIKYPNNISQEARDLFMKLF